MIARAIRPAMPTNDGIHIRLADPLPGQPDEFRFRIAADGTGTLFAPGSEMPPLQFAPAEAGEAVATGWDPARTYIADRDWPTNAEMTRIYEADQADRAAGGPAIDWSAVTPRDAARRARTLALVAAGRSPAATIIGMPPSSSSTAARPTTSCSRTPSRSSPRRAGGAMRPGSPRRRSTAICRERQAANLRHPVQHLDGDEDDHPGPL